MPVVGEKIYFAADSVLGFAALRGCAYATISWQISDVDALIEQQEASRRNETKSWWDNFWGNDDDDN